MSIRRALHELTADEAAEALGIAALLRGIRDIQLRLVLLGRAINVEGDIMSEVDDRLAQLTVEVGDAATAITDAAGDVDRALADLKNALGGTLSADQAAKFDAVDTSLAGLKNSAAAIQAAVDAADPAPAPPAPTDGGTSTT